MASQFILRQKVVDLMHHLFPIAERFPKHEKFALVAQIKNTVFRILRLTIEVQGAKTKIQILNEIDKEIEFLKELIAYSNDKRGSKYLSVQARKSCMEVIIEVGKITGGMIKSHRG
jgi:hypothetical protein